MARAYYHPDTMQIVIEGYVALEGLFTPKMGLIIINLN